MSPHESSESLALAKTPHALPAPRSRRSPARGQSVIVASGAKKVDINKQGLNSVKNDIVKKNLMGVSTTM